VAVRIDETGELEIVRHARENTRVLRRLLAGGLLVIIYLVAPGLARAGTVAIFYYPWYGTPSYDGAWQHWNQNGHLPPRDVYSSYFPAGGPYSSDDPRTIPRQMAEIASAGVNEVIVSWWGRGSLEDVRLPAVLAAAHASHLQVAIHIEPYTDRSPATVAQDLTYLASLGIRDVYVYHPADFAATDWAPVTAAKPPSIRLFAGTQLVGFAAAAGFNGFYTYDFVDFGGAQFIRLCEQAHARGLLCAPSVGPGYDAARAGEASGLRSRQSGLTYDNLWRAALAARPDIVTITSFNEWGEGTQIEPAAARRGYLSYDGSWGLTGVAAQSAYLVRTAYWATRFHSLN
jgi:glycoprotein endo-alpha-1,2-mannosidase